MKKYLLLFVFFNFLNTDIVFAQPITPKNDTCQFAIELKNLNNYFSKPAEFSNFLSTNSGDISSCNSGLLDFIGGDVWFKFRAKAPELKIVAKGNKSEGGSMTAPRIALYKGNCSKKNYLKCSVSDAKDFCILSASSLIPGEDYLFNISSELINSGTFSLYINNYYPGQVPGADCRTALLICSKDTVLVDKLEGGYGLDYPEIGVSCIGNNGIDGETSSAWFKWQAGDNGITTFVVDPLNPYDDIDFIVFESNNGDCNAKNKIRCGAAQCPEGTENIQGPTGLNLTSTDIEEFGGCQAGQDKFVKYIQQKKDSYYILIVNNYSSSFNGFVLTFGGNGIFKRPNVEIDAVLPTACSSDSLVQFNSYTLSTGSFYWDFGKDAIPAVSFQKVPPKVFYSTEGKKTVTLTINNETACASSHSIDINYTYPKPVKINLLSTISANCNDKNGEIHASAISGKSPYTYQLDNSAVQNNGDFTGLVSGNYLLKVVDANKCTQELSVNVGIKNSNMLVDFEVKLPDPCGMDKSVKVLNKSKNALVYSWTFGPDASIANGNENRDYVLNFSSEGLKILKLVVEDKDGCKAEKTISFYYVNRVKPSLDLERIDSINCLRPSATAYLLGNLGSPPYEFRMDEKKWQKSGKFENLMSGDYMVYMRDSLGCTDVKKIRVPDVSEYFNVSIDNGDDIEGFKSMLVCSGTPVKLYTQVKGNMQSYEWFPKLGIDDPFSANPTITPTQSNLYRVDVSDGKCVASDSIQIDVGEIPKLIKKSYKVNNLTVDFDFEYSPISNVTIRKIQFGDGKSINKHKGQHVYNQLGTYTVKVIIQDKCLSDTFEFELVLDGSTKDVELGIENRSQLFSDIKISTNPSGGKLLVNFNLSKNSTISYQLVDVLGRVLLSSKNMNMQHGANHLEMDVPEQSFQNSLMFFILNSDQNRIVKKFVMIH